MFYSCDRDKIICERDAKILSILILLIYLPNKRKLENTKRKRKRECSMDEILQSTTRKSI